MAHIKIEEVVDHLSSEMKRALERAVQRTCPDVKFNRNELFREFRRAVRSKCSTWECVPDRYIKAE